MVLACNEAICITSAQSNIVHLPKLIVRIDQDSKAIEDCQLRAARIVTGAKKGTSHDKLYYEAQWSKLEERRYDFKLCFMHKVVHKNAPEYLVELLPNTVGAITSYNLRNKDDFDQFDLHSEKFRKSLLPDCVRKWNSLDKQKRNESSYDTFKKNIANPLKCSSLFYIGIRKFNVIHAQLRMNCSNLNAHLHSLHVIDSPACVRSHSIEDTAHFFLYCPLYYTQRLALQNIVSRYTEFKLETLLFGDTNIDNVDNITIILAVHDYIKNSERF